jgi:hypothetical protein
MTNVSEVMLREYTWQNRPRHDVLEVFHAAPDLFAARAGGNKTGCNLTQINSRCVGSG